MTPPRRKATLGPPTAHGAGTKPKEKHMNGIRSLVKRHPLFTFFVLAYAFTWLGWIVPERVYTGTLLTTILAAPFFILLAGPLLAALTVTALTDGKSGL